MLNNKFNMKFLLIILNFFIINSLFSMDEKQLQEVKTEKESAIQLDSNDGSDYSPLSNSPEDSDEEELEKPTCMQRLKNYFCCGCKKDCRSRLKEQFCTCNLRDCKSRLKENWKSTLAYGALATASYYILGTEDTSISAPRIVAEQNFGKGIHTIIKKQNIIFKIFLTYGCAWVVGNLDVVLQNVSGQSGYNVQLRWSYPFYIAGILSAKHFIDIFRKNASRSIETAEDVIEIMDDVLADKLPGSKEFNARLNRLIEQKFEQMLASKQLKCEKLV